MYLSFATRENPGEFPSLRPPVEANQHFFEHLSSLRVERKNLTNVRRIIGKKRTAAPRKKRCGDSVIAKLEGDFREPLPTQMKIS